jgi:protein-S-isoprenylcysteine O-methyltransferase Ste14
LPTSLSSPRLCSFPQGRFTGWRAWLFLGVVLTSYSVTMFGVFAGNEELLSERYKSPVQEGRPLADKITLAVFIATFVITVVLIPLDVFRLHLMSVPRNFVSCLGLLAFIFGWCIITLAFRENAFAAPVVKLQEERHQKVIDTGVYSWVRHPMYASAPLLLEGMALWLTSYAAAAFAIVPIITIAIRIIFEERFLREALPGYDLYTIRSAFG